MQKKRIFGERNLPRRLHDPCNDRVMTNVKAPFVEEPTDQMVFPDGDLPDWQLMIEIFKGEGSLTKAQGMKIMRDAYAYLKLEPNLIRVELPATIYGDLHGQVFDLIKLLDEKNLQKDKLIFLGDYVDRGRNSIEVLLLLLALKIRHRSTVVLL